MACAIRQASNRHRNLAVVRWGNSRQPTAKFERFHEARLAALGNIRRRPPTAEPSHLVKLPAGVSMGACTAASDDAMAQVPVISDVERLWSLDQKQAVVSQVARQADLCPGQTYRRRQNWHVFQNSRSISPIVEAPSIQIRRPARPSQ